MNTAITWVSMSLLAMALNVLAMGGGAVASPSYELCPACKANGIGSSGAKTNTDQSYSDADISEVANQICDVMMTFSTLGRAPQEGMEIVVSQYLGIDRDEPDFRDHLTEFWNRHQDEMICTTEHIGYDSPQHLLKRVVEMNRVTTFYFDYFLQDRNIEVNAIEYTADGPETLIDFLDKIIDETPNADRLYNVDQLKNLRVFLTSMMDGKRADEILSEREQNGD